MPIRAKYIGYDNESGRYVVVYAFQTRTAKLRRIAAQIAVLPGAYSKAIAGSEEYADRLVPMKCVVVGIREGYPNEPIIEKMKELANPELPYSFTEVTAVVNLCECGKHDSTEAETVGLAGLEPDDDSPFWIGLKASLLELPQKGKAWEDTSEVASRRLCTELEYALEKLGAFVIAPAVILNRNVSCTPPQADAPQS